MSRQRVALGDLVTIFKGKAVPAKAEPGHIHLVNLVDMTPLGIDYEHLKTFTGDEEQLDRYLLEDGDILIASKGTQHKVAVFEEQDFPVIASANITILRPKVTGQAYYIKAFLDSEDGRKQLKATDRGRAVMNLSSKAILDIQIPDLPLVKQAYMAQRYKQGLVDYKRKLLRAEQEWSRLQADIERQLFIS